MAAEPYTESQTHVGLNMVDKEIVLIFVDDMGQIEARYQYAPEAARRVAAAIMKGVDILEGGEMSEV